MYLERRSETFRGIKICEHLALESSQGFFLTFITHESSRTNQNCIGTLVKNARLYKPKMIPGPEIKPKATL